MTEDHVIVTGAAGYIGQLLVDRLRDSYDYPVYGADINAVPQVDVRREMDVLAFDVEDARAVIHLAALPGVEACDEHPEAAIRNNVEATATVARACSYRNTRLVVASSQATRGDTLYGWTKRTAVECCRRLPDLDWVALELPNVYGGSSGDRGTVVETFVRRARAGETLPVHEPGTQERNFVHRDDVAEAFRLAMTHGEGVVPIYGPDTYSIRELASEVAKRSAVHPEFVEPDRPVGPETVDVDRSVAREALGFEAEVSMSDYLDRKNLNP